MKRSHIVSKLPSATLLRIVLTKATILILLTVFGVFLIPVQRAQTAPTGKIYYVAPDGNDNNPGTLAKPWRTIDHAAEYRDLKPGDIIYIRDGTYNERIRPGTSGANGNPIIYRNYPGESPVIGGNDGSSWRLQILDQSYLRFEGLTFKDYVGGAIQVRTVNKNITGIEIVGNIFRNQTPESGSSSKTINITPSETGNILSYIVIQDNRFFNMDTNHAPVIQFDGEVVASKIIGNTIAGSTNIGIGIAGRPNKGQPHNILIKGNEVFGHGSPDKNTAGIYLDGAGSNIVVEENIIHDGLQGIKVDIEPAAASLITQRIIVRRNILYNNSQMNLKMGAGETCSQPGALQDSVAIHNTVYSNINNIANVVFDCGQNLYWKNNIFVHHAPSEGFQYRLLEEDVDTSTWTLDYNLFVNESGEGDHYRWKARRYESLANFKNVSGQDIHSIEGNPRFSEPSNFDFALTENSSARDAGGSLTHTISAGSGTAVPVAATWFFSDGMGLQSGDMIRIGGGDLVEVIAVNHTNQTLTVDRSVTWSNHASVNYEYSASAPDIGAVEFTPSIYFSVIPQDQALLLKWDINDSALAGNITWKVEYGISGQSTTQVGLDSNVRTYSIAPLTNYQFYDITLSAIVDGEVFWVKTIQAMPTDIFTYLPIVQK